MPAPARPPGPSLRVSLIVMGLGLLVFIPSVVLAVLPFVGSIPSTAYAVPSRVQIHLRKADYVVYERTGTRSGFGGLGGLGQRNPVTIDASQVTVTAPDGARVPVYGDTNNDTMTRGSAVYTGAVEFHTPRSGTYAVDLATRNATTVLIARSIRDALRSALPWFATAAVGGGLAMTGGIMLIVGATRRGRARRAMYGWGPYWGPPPGQPPWNPPPGGAPGWGPPQWPGPQPQWPPPPAPPGQWPPPPAPPER